jgi:mono/diheme cytochrome c family protein
MLLALLASSLTAAPPHVADPRAGYDTLINGGYITCGVPAILWNQLIGDATPAFPGRRGANANLPDEVTQTRAPSGVDIVAPNCLACHAGTLLGRRVMGLGNVFVDETEPLADMVGAGRAFLPPGSLRNEVDRWLRPLRVATPRTRLDTIGVSSADDLAATLMAHRDRRTLAWLDDAALPLPDDVDPTPIDVPAWWLARTKSSVFWTGSGRGDRASLMASASLLCTDSAPEAQRIIDAFADVRAYVDTLQPPQWPWSIDDALAERGRAVFTHSCAGCHAKARVVPLARVGTDPQLAQRTASDAAPQLEWFNGSVYGRAAHLEATGGYVAQPLTGVWATAPYLHNGSVPTLVALLDSSLRPRFWHRPRSSMDFDADAVGWKVATAARGKAAERDAWARANLYDTTRPGYSNAGHTFGDALTADERRAVLEYLKTL